AWELVTGSRYFGLDPDSLRVSVHHSDDDARDLWQELSTLPADRIYSLGDRDNFWQMGDTGPCGPCSEIYVDLEWSPGQVPAMIPPAEFEVLAESGRFLEIWNLVFMQYNRSADGALEPLPRPSVDTGAGLERIAAVLQGEDDNFHTDLFRPLLDQVGELVGHPYDPARSAELTSFRVLADHTRAVSFLLADGVYPGNEGRGYVLRRILRRAVRHAWLLDRREPTLAPLTGTVIREMGDAWPELREKASFIQEVTRTEEERFLETIEGGLVRLDDLVAGGAKGITGDEAFKLYDTFGFPIDLTGMIAAERGLSVDLEGFEAALEQQRGRSRAARAAGQEETGPAVITSRNDWRELRPGRQEFVGYQTTHAETEVLAFRQSGGRVEVLLRENPFYVESGGQVSDTGTVLGEGWTLPVDAVRKDQRGTVLGGSFGNSFEPTAVDARVDTPRRRNIERNHSATHLVHKALQDILGSHVRQQGSLVEPGRLRFDFSHHEPVEPETLREIEQAVNSWVWENAPVETREMAYQDALAEGAMAFFSEKYGDTVRVVRMGPSLELCGGTHVTSTGQVGLFRFTSQGGVAAGVRRIEAVTGPGAYAVLADMDRQLEDAAGALKAQPGHVVRRIEQLVQERARLEQRLTELLRSGAAGEPEGTVTSVNGVEVTIGETRAEDRDEVAGIADRFRDGRKKGVLVLFGTAERGAVHAAVTDDLIKTGHRAGDLVQRIAALGGGKGGGRPQFASAGLGDPQQIARVREATPRLIAEWLGA
ncbi:MAG: alanine--tRNA ligase, partial [Gemmatimonadales bacterium]